MSKYRLAVVSDQALVAEAVRTALASRGLDAFVLPWPSAPDPTGPEPSPRRPDVGLMLCDLEPASLLRTAQSLVMETDAPWLLLTSAPRGAQWGAMLESGVDAILPGSTTLGQAVKILERLAVGQTLMAEADRQELVRRWWAERAERAQLSERIRSLTPRERTVLRLLFAGDTVRSIAALLGVSEATVRSHVKSLLRKMDVNSQLAAVAAFGWLQEEEGAVNGH